MKKITVLLSLFLVTLLVLSACGVTQQAHNNTQAFATLESVKIPNTTSLNNLVKASPQTPVTTVVAQQPVQQAAKPTPKPAPKPAAQVASRGAVAQPVTPGLPAGRLILIRKSAFTLTLYDNGQLVKSYSITIGRSGRDTPTGRFVVGNMLVNPEYFGNTSGTVGYIPGGDPNNPLGSRWIGIKVNGNSDLYGIHEEFYSTGRAASNGCVRLMQQDLEDLFNQVAVGTPIWIEP